MWESILSSLFSGGMLLSSFVMPGEGATDYSRYTNNGSKPISLARENTTDVANMTNVANATDALNTTDTFNASNTFYVLNTFNATDAFDRSDVIDATSVLNSTVVLPVEELVTVTCATSNSFWPTFAQFVSHNALTIGVGTVVVAVVTYCVYLKIRGPQWPVGTPGLANNEALPPNVLVQLIQQAARQVKLKVHSNNNLPGHMPGWAQTSPAKKSAFIEALRQLVANYQANGQSPLGN